MSEASSGKSLRIRVRIPDGAQPVSAAEAETRRVRPAVWVLLTLGMSIGLGTGLWPSPEPKPVAENPAPEVGVPAAVETTPAAVPTETALPPQPANPHNRVLRALIADSMRGQTPGAELSATIPAAQTTRRFYFFTEVEQPEGKRFAHLWQHEGKTTARIAFQPRNSPWRASSNKRIPSHLQGRWRAVLVDEHDNELASAEFIYGAK